MLATDNTDRNPNFCYLVCNSNQNKAAVAIEKLRPQPI
jgi:hypothetical protein